MRIARVILATVLVSSCRTAPPFPELVASTPAEAWERLITLERSFGGARMLARFTGAQSFRAVVKISANGDLQIEVLSPLGTTAATIHARGDTVRWTEQGQSHTAALSELSQRLLGVSLGDLQSRDVAMLLMALPPAPEGERFKYELTRTGLRSARSGATIVSYEPAAFPPQHIRIESPTGTLTVEVLELVRL